MGQDKIITDGLAMIGAYGVNEFGVKAVGGKGIKLEFIGDPAIIIQMLYQSSESYEHVAKTLITTVLIFAEAKGIPLEDLEKHAYPRNKHKGLILPGDIS